MAKRKKTMKEGRRHSFQGLWFLGTNAYFEGFRTGKIYQGKLKNLCVPGMNCYSCPGALGSCPIGALQAVLGHGDYRFSFYIVGFLFFVGALMGRLVCGWLCPFGLIQDLCHKIPFPRKIKTFFGDYYLRKVKYGMLLLFVILLPLFLVDVLGQGAPYFCKLICPVGMLEGGIPLVLKNKAMGEAAGLLYLWKGSILAILILLSVMIYRPFCKYLCPLGAIYSLFNPISIFGYHLEHESCTQCGVCHKVCKMNVDPVLSENALECIRCGQCEKACPTGSITKGFFQKKKRLFPKQKLETNQL